MKRALRNLDLNLLLVFDVLWTERSVSATARRISRTQSAVSLALERLRKVFDDPLFRWNGRRMQPTATAELLAPRVRAIINRIDETLELRFDDPRLAHREFTIATADYVDWLLGGRLMRRLEDEAPNLAIYFADVTPAIGSGRRSAEVELTIVPQGVMNTAGSSCAPLFRDRYVAVAARDNPRAWEGMTLDAFRALPQVTYTAHPKTLFSHETRHLAELGVRFRNLVLTPHYMAIPLIVAETGGVAVMQERLARYMAERVPLKLITPPLPYPELDITLYWHPQYDDDATHRWLRETIVAIATALPALPDRATATARAQARKGTRAATPAVRKTSQGVARTARPSGRRTR